MCCTSFVIQAITFISSSTIKPSPDKLKCSVCCTSFVIHVITFISSFIIKPSPNKLKCPMCCTAFVIHVITFISASTIKLSPWWLKMAAWGRTGPELRQFIPYPSGTGQSTRVWSGLGGMQVSLDHLCQKTPETSFRRYSISITFSKNVLAIEKLNFMNWSWWLLGGLPSLQSLYGIPLSLVSKGPHSGAPSLRIGD